MTRTQISRALIDSIAARYGRRWHLDSDGQRLTVTWQRAPQRSCRARHTPSPAVMLHRIESALGRHGIRRGPLLPLRWGRDTDLTISAVQALDPWLKDGSVRVWREGYLPQPVVRFTGERDDAGRLRDGFLTSFVNISCVRRIRSVREHVDLIDAWIDVFSALGLHASRLTLHGDTAVWRRGSVEGITVFIDCDGHGIADAVLLWHAGDPTRMASDLGSGLERLRWLIGGQSWSRLIHSELVDQAETDVLDAIRTATLLVMNGVRPAARGAGAAVRRLAREISRCQVFLGLSRAVRFYHAYWTEVGVRGIGWPHVTTTLEQLVLQDAERSRDCA